MFYKSISIETVEHVLPPKNAMSPMGFNPGISRGHNFETRHPSDDSDQVWFQLV
jgi:hypothetical protein